MPQALSIGRDLNMLPHSYNNIIIVVVIILEFLSARLVHPDPTQLTILSFVNTS